MIKTLIVDDEMHSRAMMKILLENRDDVELIGESDSAFDAMNKIVNCNPDLVFLDIKMPGMTGFEMIDELLKIGVSNLDIIFLTAYNEYAIKAIKYSAFDYLLKPIDEVELEKSINRFKIKRKIGLLGRNNDLINNALQNQIYKIKSKDGYTFVNFDDIVYVEGDSNYSFFILNDGRKVNSSKTIKLISEELPERSFVRVHKAFLVGAKYLRNYNAKDKVCNLCTSKEEYLIPVSSRMLKNLMDL